MINSEKFSRQIQLEEIGIQGQKALKKSKIIILGLGGLGTSAAQYLSGAGVGTLGIVDYDKVELSNLNRQFFYTQEDLGRKKVDVASKKIKCLNPEIFVRAIDLKISTDSLMNNDLSQYDFVIEATDCGATKRIINKYCIDKKIPCCIGGVDSFSGHILTIIPSHTACYNCVFPENTDTSKMNSVGVIGVTTGIIGIYQAAEAIKYIIGKGKLSTNKLLTINIRDNIFRNLELKRKKNVQFVKLNVIDSPL